VGSQHTHIVCVGFSVSVGVGVAHARVPRWLSDMGEGKGSSRTSRCSSCVTLGAAPELMSAACTAEARRPTTPSESTGAAAAVLDGVEAAAAAAAGWVDGDCVSSSTATEVAAEGTRCVFV